MPWHEPEIVFVVSYGYGLLGPSFTDPTFNLSLNSFNAS